MTNSELQTVYRSVVVAKIIYVASAWWAFDSIADRQGIDAFIVGVLVVVCAPLAIYL